MMKGRLPLALLGNDRLVQGAWCVGFADIPRFRLAVPTPNLIESHRPLAGGVPSRTTADTVCRVGVAASGIFRHASRSPNRYSIAGDLAPGRHMWVGFLPTPSVLYTFEVSASHPIAVVTFLHSFSHIRSVYRVSHLFFAHWQPRGSCRWCPDESTSTTPVVSISIRFVSSSSRRRRLSSMWGPGGIQDRAGVAIANLPVDCTEREVKNLGVFLPGYHSADARLGNPELGAFGEATLWFASPKFAKLAVERLQ